VKDRVSIRLADAWPFQRARAETGENPRARFQSALRMRGLFNAASATLPCPRPRRFQSALRMRGLFNHGGSAGEPPPGPVSIRLADAWPFQLGQVAQGKGAEVVSIRLADAWPFQPPTWPRACRPSPGFNPPCGCVAFSTRVKRADIRLRRASFNPPCGCVAFSTPETGRVLDRQITFQSALRMRGLFNHWPLQRPH